MKNYLGIAEARQSFDGDNAAFIIAQNSMVDVILPRNKITVTSLISAVADFQQMGLIRTALLAMYPVAYDALVGGVDSDHPLTLGMISVISQIPGVTAGTVKRIKSLAYSTHRVSNELEDIDANDLILAERAINIDLLRRANDREYIRIQGELDKLEANPDLTVPQTIESL